MSTQDTSEAPVSLKDRLKQFQDLKASSQTKARQQQEARRKSDLDSIPKRSPVPKTSFSKFKVDSTKDPDRDGGAAIPPMAPDIDDETAVTAAETAVTAETTKASGGTATPAEQESGDNEVPAPAPAADHGKQSCGIMESILVLYQVGGIDRRKPSQA
jgi:hypothetical protein